MNKEQELLERYNIIPTKISYQNKTKVITTNTESYCLKIKSSPTNSIYQYLDTHNFQNYLRQINDLNDPYEIYPYITEKNIDKETKAIDLIYTLSLLHNKTTTYQEINLDKIKKIYEETTNKINYLLSYYYDLQDYIENKVYMSPAEYLLIRNIKSIYISLNNARYDIDKWFKLKQKSMKERQVFLHGNVSLEHFLEGNNNYLINWKKATQGNVIYDFLDFFKNEYKVLEMENLYNLYQSKYQYTEDEKLLFSSLIQIPWKITFKESNYINTLHVKDVLTYLEKANHLILKEHEKDQKTQEEKFDK